MQNKSCTTYYCLSCLSHYLQIFFFQLVQEFFQQSQVFTATHLRQLSSRALVGTTIARLLPTLAPRFGIFLGGMSDLRFGSLTGTVGCFFWDAVFFQPFWYMTDSADPPCWSARLMFLSSKLWRETEGTTEQVLSCSYRKASGTASSKSKVGGKFSMNMAMQRVDNVSEFIKMLTLCKECFSLCSDRSFSVFLCVWGVCQEHGTGVCDNFVERWHLTKQLIFCAVPTVCSSWNVFKKAMAKLEALFCWHDWLFD